MAIIFWFINCEGVFSVCCNYDNCQMSYHFSFGENVILFIIFSFLYPTKVRLDFFYSNFSLYFWIILLILYVEICSNNLLLGWKVYIFKIMYTSRLSEQSFGLWIQVYIIWCFLFVAKFSIPFWFLFVREVRGARHYYCIIDSIYFRTDTNIVCGYFYF